MNDKVAVYGQRRAGVYLLSEIYDPDKVTSSVQNVGTVIPAVGSIVIDDSTTEHNTLYVVYSVDAVTFKTTLVAATVNTSSGTGDTKIISYGNDMFMLYYKARTDVISGKVVYEMVIDNKISIYGNSACTFSIFRGSSITESSSNTVALNHYYDYVLTTDTVFKGNVTYYTRTGEGTKVLPYVYKEAVVEVGATIPANTYYVIALCDGTRAPLERLNVPGKDAQGEYIVASAMLPTVTYSDTAITSGENFVFTVYDYDGKMVAQMSLTAHEVLGLSALAKTQMPIESFKVSANQYDATLKKAYLNRGQSVSELQFYADVTYSNGDHISSAEIDNSQLFIYGVEDISTETSGAEYTVLFKYFLNNNEKGSEGKNYSIGDTARYIYTTLQVMIIDSASSSISKIAMMVEWDDLYKYQLFPLVYFRNRQQPAICANTDWLASTYNGGLYGSAQSVSLRTYEQMESDTVPSAFYQNYNLTLFNPTTVDDSVYYQYRDNPCPSGNIYGKNTTSCPRPIVHFQIDKDDSTIITYFIPRNVFWSEDMFLNSFYYKADPPYWGTDVEPKKPTHFQIRKLDITNKTVTVATAAPIAIAQYYENLALTTTLHRSGVPASCIVEFLYKTDAMENYEYLFGVPVDVVEYTESEAESGDSFRGNLYFVYMNPDKATLNYITMAYAGTDRQKGFNRTWSGTTDNTSCSLRYDKAEKAWILTYTGATTSESKTVTNATTDNMADITTMDWNQTTDWKYKHVITLSKTDIPKNLVAYYSFDINNSTNGVINSQPTIHTPAAFVTDAEKGTYLRINPTQETVTSYQHAVSGVLQPELYTRDSANDKTVSSRTYYAWTYTPGTGETGTAGTEYTLVEYPTAGTVIYYFDSSGSHVKTSTLVSKVNKGSAVDTQGYVESLIHSGWLAWDKDFTVEMWVKMEANNKTYGLISSSKECYFGVGANINSITGHYHMLLSDWETDHEYNRWYGDVTIQDTDGAIEVTETGGVWQHIAVTHEAKSHDYNFYLNGVLVKTERNVNESESRPRILDKILLGKWGEDITPAHGGFYAQNTCIHGFRLSADVRYPGGFNPKWDVMEDPEIWENILIPTLQLDEESREEPHYKVQIGSFTNTLTYPIKLFANGSADDDLEIIDTNNTILYTDHDASVSGACHTYSNKSLCTVPAGKSFTIWIWDTAYSNIKWNGTIKYSRSV